MVKIHPQKLSGDWKEGFALDFHTLRSDYIGDDEFGHPQFDTIRSEVGELLYRLKYRSDKSVLKVLVNTAAEFVERRKWAFEVVISVPPSRPGRVFQPVPLLAKGIGQYFGVPTCLDCVVKVKDTPELKSVYDFSERMDILKDAYTVAKPDTSGRKVLLVDDLFRSGATLKAITQSLLAKGGADRVYVVTFTKTRSNR
jgi:predicted amidophosphoribosyltransferase